MSNGDDIFEQIKLFLPKYLTPDQQNKLWSELASFPENRSFYLLRHDLEEEILQGDGWQGFIVLNFLTGNRKNVSGVVLSNSCDISPKNQRDFPPNILFAPLIQLPNYVQRLEQVGKTADQIRNILENIRRQRVTSIFYFPECLGKNPESIILLHDIHAHPMKEFFACNRNALFTLNQYAFYILLMKLSIHFSRFQEGVQRFETSA